MAQSKTVLFLVVVGAFVVVQATAEDASAENAKAASLLTGCLHFCNNKICRRTGKEDVACSARCDKTCHVNVERLSFYADVYAKAPPTEKTAVIQAIDKQASGPLDKVEGGAVLCMVGCSPFCSQGMKDPACATICYNGCYGNTVSGLLLSATPAKKEAINKDIEAAMVTTPKM